MFYLKNFFLKNEIKNYQSQNFKSSETCAVTTHSSVWCLLSASNVQSASHGLPYFFFSQLFYEAGVIFIHIVLSKTKVFRA